jgi:hypothetical protein
MRLIACGASVTGPVHLEAGQPNQDALALYGHKGGWVVAVGDGLGSHAHGDLGARRACQIARRTLRELVSIHPDDGLNLHTVLPLIHARWLNAIRPFPPRESGTTLLFARVSTSGKVQACQLGDGLLLMKCGGRMRCISPARDGFANQTHALGSTHKPDHWTTAEGTLSAPGDGVVLMIDGVADDLDPEQLDRFFETLHAKMTRRGRRRGRRWVQRKLVDWPTPNHTDDKTLAGIFRVAP